MALKSGRFRLNWKTLGMVLLDIVMINIAMMLALQMRYDMEVPQGHLDHFWRIAPLMTGFTLISFWVTGMYRSLWRYAGVEALAQIAAGTLMGCLSTYLFSLVCYTLSPEPNLFLMPRTVYLIDWFLLLFMVGFSRLSIRLSTQWRHGGGLPFPRSKGARRILVVGAGWAGNTVIRDIQSGRYGQSRAVAAVDDDGAKNGTRIHGVPVVMGTDRVAEYAQRFSADEIIIAIATPQGQLNQLVDKCLQTSCKLRMVSSLKDVTTGQTALGRVRDVNIDDLLCRDEEHLDMTDVETVLTGKTVLVTGGGGSIGSEMCRQVMAFAPKKLVIYDVSENYMYDLYHELQTKYGSVVKNTLVLCVGSVRDPQRLEEVFSRYQPQVVIHAAAHKHVPLMEDCPIQAVKNNVLGTYETALCAMRHGAERFVMISTDKAVNPTNIMGATKRLAEIIIEALQKKGEGRTQFTAVRFGNVLGSHGSVIPLFEKQIRAGGPVTLTHPEIIRYFMTISEAASLVLQAASIARGGELFVLDMGRPVKIRELAERMIQLYADPDGPPVTIEYVGLRPGEKLYEELLLKGEDTARTRKEKIFVARPEQVEWVQVEEMLARLKECIAREGDMRALLHELLPAFKTPEEVNGRAASSVPPVSSAGSGLSA